MNVFASFKRMCIPYLDKGLELVEKLGNQDEEVVVHMKDLREKLGDGNKNTLTIDLALKSSFANNQ